MYRRILIPMALDHGVAERSVAIARSLLEDGGEMIALHVYEAPQGSVSAYIDEEVAKTAFVRARDHLEARARALGGLTPVLLKGHSARTILEYADQNDVECIIVGSHRPGLSDYLLGSTAARVARHAQCAVHVTRVSD